MTFLPSPPVPICLLTGHRGSTADNISVSHSVRYRTSLDLPPTPDRPFSLYSRISDTFQADCRQLKCPHCLIPRRRDLDDQSRTVVEYAQPPRCAIMAHSPDVLRPWCLLVSPRALVTVQPEREGSAAAIACRWVERCTGRGDTAAAVVARSTVACAQSR